MKGLLRDNFPELRSQWSDKNEKSFDEVMTNSNKDAEWICADKHTWVARIDSRTKKRASGCPYCKNRKASDTNSLLVCEPKLCKEWDYKENGELKPEMVTRGSFKTVWWRCRYGHSYSARISSRVGKNRQGCPYCDGKKVDDSNSLATKYPSLVKQWIIERNYPLTIYNISSGSNRKVWWECINGHKYQCTVWNRVAGYGCPKCNNQTSRLEIFTFCELYYYFPDIQHRIKIDKVECDLYIPSINIGIEIDGGRWHKDKEDKDRSKVQHFKDRGIFLISVREEGLGIVNENTIQFKRNSDKFKYITKPLMDILFRITNIGILGEYTLLSNPINEEMYKDEMLHYPLNFKKVT